MIDHLALHVSNYQKSKQFYLAALRPLEYGVVVEFLEWSACGLGKEGKPDFWISGDGAGKPTHIAFAAENRALVDEFYKAALAAGGKDNGAPGIRKDYHPNYYGAFVFDGDGNNIEVVCHKAE